MIAKRYLLLEGETNGFPAIVELPYEKLSDAIEALEREFKRLVDGVFGKDHVIKYDQNGDAELIDDDGIRYSLVHDGGEDSPSFFVHDGKGTVYTGVLREITIHANATELERGYRQAEHKYLLEDAERHFLEYVGFDVDADEEDGDNAAANQTFMDTYGFSIGEAINDSSESYLLDDMVELFERKRDCNLPENDVWENVVQAVLMRCAASRR